MGAIPQNIVERELANIGLGVRKKTKRWQGRTGAELHKKKKWGQGGFGVWRNGVLFDSKNAFLVEWHWQQTGYHDLKLEKKRK